jgi:hypothetical protein
MIVSVSIAGVICDVLDVTSTQIECQTGSYDKSTTKALVQVYIENIGLASNVSDNILTICVHKMHRGINFHAF